MYAEASKTIPLPCYDVLELVSKPPPKQYPHTGKMHKPEEVLGVVFIPGNEPPRVLQPGIQPFNLPAMFVAPQLSPVLERF